MITFGLSQHVGQPGVVETGRGQIFNLETKTLNLYFDKGG